MSLSSGRSPALRWGELLPSRAGRYEIVDSRRAAAQALLRLRARATPSPPPGSSDDDVAPGSARSSAASTRSSRVTLADSVARRDTDDDVRKHPPCSCAPGGSTARRARPPRRRAGAELRRRRAHGHHTSTLRRSAPAAARTRLRTKSAAIESPAGKPAEAATTREPPMCRRKRCRSARRSTQGCSIAPPVRAGRRRVMSARVRPDHDETHQAGPTPDRPLPGSDRRTQNAS